MKKLIFVISFMVVSGFLFGLTAPDAKAVTTAELQTLIQQLRTQIAQLQQQLAEIEVEKTLPVWCHDFNVSLKIGDSGSEVTALQTALSKEGLYTRKVTGIFDEYTASVVVAFQEKYASEVLAPWGLTHGTGYVGSTTRAKLNKLYGCGVVRPYIQVVSPNGGEKWVIGETYSIVWQAKGLNTVNINLGDSVAGRAYGVVSKVPASQGKYSWTIPSTIPESSTYRIQIGGDYKGSAFDESDNYFSITKGKTCHTSPLWSWDYCSPACQCSAGEGDCDSNADCTTGYCAQNVGTKYGQVSTMDVCEGKEVCVQRGSACCLGDLCNSVMITCEEGKKPVFKGCDANCTPQWECLPSTLSITVISPNGGETWTEENTYKITWNQTGLDQVKINIELLAYKQDGTPIGKPYQVATNISAGQEYYSWRIPSKIYEQFGLSPDKYKVRLANYKGAIAVDGEVIDGDESDDYFSIVSPTSACTDSDGGRNYYVRGNCLGRPNIYTDQIKILTDYCITPRADYDYNLIEFACGYIQNVLICVPYAYKCPYGCQDGACQKGEEESITDTTGLKAIENQLASLTEAVSKLMEQVKNLIGR